MNASSKNENEKGKESEYMGYLLLYRSYEKTKALVLRAQM
jgi:hypothetical protein